MYGLIQADAAEWTAMAILGTSFLLVMRWMLHTVSKQLSDVGNAIRTHALVQLDMHKTLIIHDAQIRGVNPTAGEDLTAAHEQAFGEYKRVLASLDATSEAIKASMAGRQSTSPWLPV